MTIINIQTLALFISALSVIISSVSTLFAVRGFRRQQRTSRLQNLITTFQRFSNTDDFIEIFALCDSYYVRLNDESKKNELVDLKNDLEKINIQKKLKYLALLEEVAIWAKNSEVIKDTALHLFKFHFYYVYGDHPVSDAFWCNVGSGSTEKSKDGWSFQNAFARTCIPAKSIA